MGPRWVQVRPRLQRTQLQKQAFRMGGVSKIKVFSFSTKVALGRGLGALFEVILKPKLEPRGTKLGPCGQKDPRETETKAKQQKRLRPGWLRENFKWLEPGGAREGERSFEATF